MPHFGQSPGPGWRTSGSIGQVYSFVADFDAEVGPGNLFPAACDATGTPAVVTPEICTAPVELGATPAGFFGNRYFAGSKLNFSLQPPQQK